MFFCWSWRLLSPECKSRWCQLFTVATTHLASNMNIHFPTQLLIESPFYHSGLTGCGAHPACVLQWFSWDKVAGVWSWPHTSAKNEWNYSSTHPVCLHGMQRDIFMCTHSIKVLCGNFMAINTFCSISPITESTNKSLYSHTVICLEIIDACKVHGHLCYWKQLAVLFGQ